MPVPGRFFGLSGLPLDQIRDLSGRYTEHHRKLLMLSSKISLLPAFDGPETVYDVGEVATVVVGGVSRLVFRSLHGLVRCPQSKFDKNSYSATLSYIAVELRSFTFVLR